MMDVNGTRFHLIKSAEDWQSCCRPVENDGRPRVTWNEQRGALTLQPVLSLFPRGRRDLPLEPDVRRGSAVDAFGNWYWIAQDRRRIYWRPSGSKRSVVYWDQTMSEPPETKPAGDFTPTAPAQPEIELAGLAVTADHYLVAGNVTEGGLIVLDLHSGGPAQKLPFPDGSPPFVPFDIAPSADGGVWVLDSENRMYWGLDRTFRFVAEVGSVSGIPPEPPVFTSTGGKPAAPPVVSARGFPLPETSRPVSIVTYTDGRVLILDSPDGADFSTIHLYEMSSHLESYPLTFELDVVVSGRERARQLLQIVGHDLAYDGAADRVYVVERDGNQAIGLTLGTSPDAVEVSHEYLPMQASGGRALVSGLDGVYYDVAGTIPTLDHVVRWVALRPVPNPYYARSATLIVGQPGQLQSPPEMLVFDGKAWDCVWHRLYLDACLPPETAVRVWTRAHNDRDLLQSMPFRPEPAPYLRHTGAELPFYNPYPDKETPPQGTGTWELLFQEAQGRYMQMKLELAGNGRTTPQLRAMRVYYPRFSYPRRFLPAVYVDYSRPGPFLERLLANMEGIFSDIEGKMQAVNILFDPRTAPPEALDWLAGWVGLLLDPLWAKLQQEKAPYVPGRSRVPDRRRLFIRFARLLFQRRGTPDGIRFALELLLEPCLEAMMDRLRDAAVGRDEFITAELGRYGLPSPTPTTSEAALEDLLYEWVLRRPSNVRIVEDFLIRRGRGKVSGDPTAGDMALEEESFEDFAHRFRVLIPMDLHPDEEAMVQRIINLEKPAHTVFTLHRYWEGFRISEARLGLDTSLDTTNRFVAMLLGRDYLSAGYVAAGHPMNVPDRIIADRDRLGQMPPL